MEHQLGSSRVVKTISGREQATVRRMTTVAKMIEALVSESKEQAR